MTLQSRPTVAKININNLRHNAREITAKLPEKSSILAIIKANAYGHGSVFAARALESCGIKKFGVATFDEGMELRRQGMRSEIYVLNGLMGPTAEYLSNRLYPVLYQIEHLKELCDYISKENREFAATLKFDTGMGRLGFQPSQVDEIFAMLRYCPFLKINSVITHLASADIPNEEQVKRQFTLFRKLRDIMNERGVKNASYSICNSAAILDGRFEDFNWVRPGIALYGCYPNVRQRELLNLKPVMEIKTKIISLKKLSPASTVGYGATFTTTRDTTAAVIPIGYADGLPRLLSNRGHVLVRGHKAPIIGRVSMDLCTIDVTDIDGIALYDDVTVIGTDGNLTVTAEDIALWADTIAYEVLCGITARVPRLYEGM